MSLPDNFTGAFLLSVVDFFPLLNKLGEVLERKD